MTGWAEFLEPDAGEDRFLSWPKVRAIADISRSTAWRLQNAGEFPLPVVLSPGRVGWSEREVTAWKRSRSPRRDQAGQSFSVQTKTAVRSSLTKNLRCRTEPPLEPPASPARCSPAAGVAPTPVRTQPTKARRTKPEAEGQTAFEF